MTSASVTGIPAVDEAQARLSEEARGDVRPSSPYVGLVPYGEDDAPFFFGRSTEAAIVAMNLRTWRLTILYGPSGVGKSSLLMAGAVHGLREQARTDAGDENPFAVCVFRSWREDPLRGVQDAARNALQELAGADSLPAPLATLPDTLRAWTARVGSLLLVFDQFEEYFQYHPDEGNDQELRGFAAEFARIVNDPSLPVNVLLSIREDAWAKLDLFEGHVPSLFSNYVRIDHLDLDAAREAIEGPIGVWNQRLEAAEQPFAIEPALVDAVLTAAAGGGLALTAAVDSPEAEAQAAGDRVEAPFLQLVLDRLWRETVRAGEHTLTLARLEQLGGAARIVENHLLDALGRLTPAEQDAASACFRFLVSRSKTKIAHPVSDLAEWTQRSEAELTSVLDKLCSGESGRILRAVAPAEHVESMSYELFHDVLAEPILDWRRHYEQERARRLALRRFLRVGIGLLVLVLAFAAFAAWALHERGIAADRADAAESQALAAESIRAQTLDPRRSLVLAAQAEAKSSTPQADEALRRALVSLPRPIVLVPRRRTVYSVDFSPDGRFVATAGQGGARVLSVQGRVVTTLVAPMLATSVRFSSDSRFVVVATADGRVRVWRVAGWRDLPSGARVRGNRFARAAFSGGGRFLVAGGYPGWPTNRVWRFDGSRVGRELTKADDVGGWIDPDGSGRVVDVRAAESAARLVRLSPYTFASGRKGEIFVAASGAAGANPDSGGGVATVVFDTRTGRSRAKLPHSLGVALSPNGARVSLQGYSSNVIWDTELLEPDAIMAGSARAASATPATAGTSFSPDGRLAVTSLEFQKTTRVWDSGNGATLADLPPLPPRFHGEVALDDPYRLRPPRVAFSGTGQGASGAADIAFVLVPMATFSPHGDLVATWGRSGLGAQLWRPFGTRLLGRLRVGAIGSRASLLLPTVLSPDGRFVATADRNGEIRLSSTRDGRPRAILRGSTRFVSQVAFSPDGKLVAAASFDHGVRIWHAADGHLVRTLRGHKGRVGDVAFGPDGKLLASASADGTARIWRVDDGEPLHVLRASGPLTAVSFSSDGARVATAGGRGITQVWSTRSWKPQVELGPTRSRALVLRASFSRDGRYIATLDLDGTARIWHSNGGRPIRTLKNVATVVFSPRADQVLVGGGDATGRIFRASDGKQIGLLRGHSRTVDDATFSPQGDLIVTAADGGSVRVWQAATNGTVASVTPLRANPVRKAMLAAGGRLVIVTEDGVLLYSCDSCLRPAQLLAQARRRLATTRH